MSLPSKGHLWSVCAEPARQWSVKERSCSRWLHTRAAAAAGGALHVFTSNGLLYVQGDRLKRTERGRGGEKTDQRQQENIACIFCVWSSLKKTKKLPEQNQTGHTDDVYLHLQCHFKVELSSEFIFTQ